MNIALDPGFGSTKVCADPVAGQPEIAVLQSAVARPRIIGQAASGLNTSAVADQVTIGATAYLAGENSWQWGEPLGGLDYSALVSEPRLALCYATLARILPPGSYTANLAIGLPVPLMQDEAQYKLLQGSLTAAYKGEHLFTTPAGSYILTIKTLIALAQPVGAWADWLIGPDLRPRKGGKDAEVAVLDIGLNTLDLYVVQGGRVEPRYVGGAKAGVRRILVGINGHGLDLEEVDAALRAGRVKPTREDLDSWLAQIFGVVEGVWTDLRRFSAVIPAGGGACLLGDLLRTSLIARGATIAWPANPVTANASGLWKWLAYTARK